VNILGELVIINKLGKPESYIKKDDTLKLKLFYDQSLDYNEDVIVDNQGFFAH
jgi:hypothetical protein